LKTSAEELIKENHNWFHHGAEDTNSRCR